MWKCLDFFSQLTSVFGNFVTFFETVGLALFSLSLDSGLSTTVLGIVFLFWGLATSEAGFPCTQLTILRPGWCHVVSLCTLQLCKVQLLNRIKAKTCQQQVVALILFGWKYSKSPFLTPERPTSLFMRPYFLPRRTGHG